MHEHHLPIWKSLSEVPRKVELPYFTLVIRLRVLYKGADCNSENFYGA